MIWSVVNALRPRSFQTPTWFVAVHSEGNLRLGRRFEGGMAGHHTDYVMVSTPEAFGVTVSVFPLVVSGTSARVESARQ